MFRARSQVAQIWHLEIIWQVVHVLLTCETLLFRRFLFIFIGQAWILRLKGYLFCQCILEAQALSSQNGQGLCEVSLRLVRLWLLAKFAVLPMGEAQKKWGRLSGKWKTSHQSSNQSVNQSINLAVVGGW